MFGQAFDHSCKVFKVIKVTTKVSGAISGGMGAFGMLAFAAIRAGDRVTAADEETLEVAEQSVVVSYVREVTRLVRMTVAGETISTTVDHSFYVSGRGFVAAGALLEGDALVDAAGAVHTPVEAIRQEATEEPVTVYNLQVEDSHTYHVGKPGILAHNASYDEKVAQPKANGE